jgi:hypothetical protein
MLNRWGPATVLVVLTVLIIVLAGAVVTIARPASLSFQAYLTALAGAAAASGLLSLGRGQAHAGASHAKAAQTFANAQASRPMTLQAPMVHIGGGADDAKAMAGSSSSWSSAQDVPEPPADDLTESGLASPTSAELFAGVEPHDPEQLPHDEGDWQAHTDPEVPSA